jgi:hypothetical protein
MITTDPKALVQALDKTCLGALERAVARCARAKSPEVILEHFLLGLLDDDASDFSMRLAFQRVDAIEVRRMLDERLRHSPTGSAGKPILSVYLLQLMEDALSEASENGEKRIRNDTMLALLWTQPARYSMLDTIEDLTDLDGVESLLLPLPSGASPREEAQARLEAAPPPPPTMPSGGQHTDVSRMDYDLELSECARRLGPPPRRFSIWSRLGYLRVPQPQWVTREKDDLQHFFESTSRLLSVGRLTWGCIVQANRRLFEPGKDDCPGEVVYGAKPRQDPPLESLIKIGRDLYELKGTVQSDPAFATIASYLTDEYTRVFGLRVPKVVSGTSICAVSTLFFVRKHLPDRVLARKWFPTLVLDEAPNAAMVLPSRYWSDNLVAAWTRAAAPARSGSIA